MRLNTENAETRYGESGVLEYMKGENLTSGIKDSLRLRELQKKDRYEDIACIFLGNIKELLRVEDPLSEFKKISEQVDNLKMKHLTFQQVFKGIPVWHKQVKIHLNKRNEVYLFQGNSVPTPAGVDINPGITVDEAITLAAKGSPKGERGWKPQQHELVVYVDESLTPRIAYEIGLVKGLEGRETVLVDAVKGAILKRISGIHDIP